MADDVAPVVLRRIQSTVGGRQQLLHLGAVLSGVRGADRYRQTRHHGCGSPREDADPQRGNGSPNPFGHPSRITLDKLREHHIRVYRTDRDGTITLFLNQWPTGVAVESSRVP